MATLPPLSPWQRIPMEGRPESGCRGRVSHGKGACGSAAATAKHGGDPGWTPTGSCLNVALGSLPGLPGVEGKGPGTCSHSELPTLLPGCFSPSPLPPRLC